MASFVRAIRPLIAVGRVAFPKHAAVSVRTAISPLSIAARSFSVSVARAGHGRADVDLSKQLKNELDHEQAYKEDGKFVDTFLAENEWKIDSNPGSSEITMTKTFGNEKIRVLFSISDINNSDTEEFDPEMDAEESGKDEDETSFIVHAVVSCEKPGKGVLTFETELAAGNVEILSVARYPTVALAHGADNESDWQRRGLYSGPVFNQLEEDLQNQFADYLDDRGIDTEFAEFVPKLIEFSEQKEYVNWLGKVREYVDA